MDMITGTNTNAAAAAPSVSRDFLHMLSVVNWSAPSQDLFVVVLFIVTVFLYGISLGRGRIVVVLVSLYMAFAVMVSAPIPGAIYGVNVGQFFAWKVLAFLLLFGVLLLLVSRSALMRVVSHMAAPNWWQVLLFSILHVGLIVSISLSFLPPEFLRNLAPITKMIFANDVARFAWIVAPMLGMLLLRTE